jgi:Rieske 2Fe-2S family protein
MARPIKAFQQQKTDYKNARPPEGIMAEFDAYFDLAAAGDEGFQYGRNPLIEGKVSGSKDGGPLAPRLGNLPEYTGGASELMIGPLMYFLIYDDHMVGYRYLPVSQRECVCDIFWFVRDDAVEGTDYEIADLIWLWDVTTKSDQWIIENNQNGVDSRFYTPGPLSDMEHFLLSFLSWYGKSLSK